ncbi:hypothetical protein RclHR1_11160007 [Rhizophagus clarus]|uniref:C2H2-type domain-containing protein n=1 Tax=Rhizophagus clarus TaxID=94130 RepID=A0A2Z6QIM9_9GLOM|nr:hypothetical protein RclHR1_11160007 [Rhizophagus clarus]
MNKETNSTKALTNPSLYPLVVIDNTKCRVCEKHFNSSRGLTRHMNMIRKYNEIPKGQEKIPEFLINKFKEDIVYLIHQRLGKNSRNTGLQSISMACPVSLYKVIFRSYIHYHTKKTGAFKCIFRGTTGYQELTSIFNNPNWGVKCHTQKQQTYVQLGPLCSKLQENPLLKLRKQLALNTRKNSRRSKYPYGEVIIEWKRKTDIDAKGNVCCGGFLYIHFFEFLFINDDDDGDDEAADNDNDDGGGSETN